MKNDEIQGGNFSFTPSQKEISPLTSREIEHNLRLYTITFPRAHFSKEYYDQGSWLSERSVQHSGSP